MENEASAGEAAFFAADNLKAGGIAHGFFIRTGGVSEGIYASLNCGRGSADLKDRVEENRARVAAQLGAERGMLTGPKQAHTARALIVTAPWKPGEAPEADAVVTNVRGLAVSVLTADCAPILFADPEAGVVAAAHAGWKGAKAGIAESTIEAMESLGARPERIAAAIGPCHFAGRLRGQPRIQGSVPSRGPRQRAVLCAGRKRQAALQSARLCTGPDIE